MSLAVTVLPAPAPIGALTLGVTDVGLALVGFGDVPELAERAAARLGEPLTSGTAATADARVQLTEYLAGRRRTFDLPLDWRLTAGSQRRVLEALHETVPFGATVTYGELAARSGLGRAYTGARGVGAIMGSNPLPVVVPCHRVLASDGLGGFGGGRATKEWLLALEGVLTASFDLG
jgi:methylated-DNA-[protein]-cysteine S-methyltransferase